jgi:hypothetical protein
METREEMQEAIAWARKKLDRIEKYEQEGRMPRACKNRLPLETMIVAYSNLLASPTDPQAELWERSIDLAHKQLI